jgi:hypothetical protein
MVLAAFAGVRAGIFAEGAKIPSSEKAACMAAAISDCRGRSERALAKSTTNSAKIIVTKSA